MPKHPRIEARRNVLDAFYTLEFQLGLFWLQSGPLSTQGNEAQRMPTILIRYDEAVKYPNDFYEHMAACPDCSAYYRIMRSAGKARQVSQRTIDLDLSYELLFEARRVVHAEHPLHPTKRFSWGIDLRWTPVNELEKVD